MNELSGPVAARGEAAAQRLAALAASTGTPLIACGDLHVAFGEERAAHGRCGPIDVWVAGTLVVGAGSGVAGAGSDAAGTGSVAGAAAEPSAGLAAALARGIDPAELARGLRGAALVLAHDARSDRTWLLRDPLGARTLHYAGSGRTLVLAEHLVDLLALLPATPTPDRAAVVQWIATRSLAPGRTWLDGVARLSAGEALRIDRDRAGPMRVWTPRYREPLRAAPAELGAHVAETAFAAVARSAAGARRAGVRLSGGLDSACVAAGLAACGHGSAVALARTFPADPAIDESSLIAATAQMTGLELVCLPYADVALPEPMIHYAERWAQPAPTPNLALAPPLYAAARERGVERVLDGEGGDEMFGAWPGYLADLLWRGAGADAWRLTERRPGGDRRLARRARARLLVSHGLRGGLPSVVRLAGERLEVVRGALATGLVRVSDAPRLLHDVTADPWTGVAGPRWWREAVAALAGRGDRLEAPGTLARGAALGGVAASHPFLHDVTLLETMLAVDPAAALARGHDRAPLRDGLTGRIPEAVRTRRTKSVFNELSTRRLEGGDGMRLRRDLAARDAPIRAYVRPAGLARAIDPATARALGRHRHAAWLFRLAAVDLWLRALQDGRAGRAEPD